MVFSLRLNRVRGIMILTGKRATSNRCTPLSALSTTCLTKRLNFVCPNRVTRVICVGMTMKPTVTLTITMLVAMNMHPHHGFVRLALLMVTLSLRSIRHEVANRWELRVCHMDYMPSTKPVEEVCWTRATLATLHLY